MPLDSSQLKALNDWLKSKGANKICAACGGGRWQIVGEINVMPQMTGGAMRGPSSGFPVVTVVCQACGAIRCFSAVALGLVK